jgi:antitoxin (DNA-binding transcriptional repressor) of toxin-antitoxin stability system
MYVRKQISVEEAAGDRETLIDDVATGAEYEITRDGQPSLVPVEKIGFGPFDPEGFYGKN